MSERARSRTPRGGRTWRNLQSGPPEVIDLTGGDVGRADRQHVPHGVRVEIRALWKRVHGLELGGAFMLIDQLDDTMRNLECRMQRLERVARLRAL
jgi:hypothetical protein